MTANLIFLVIFLVCLAVAIVGTCFTGERFLQLGVIGSGIALFTLCVSDTHHCVGRVVRVARRRGHRTSLATHHDYVARADTVHWLVRVEPLALAWGPLICGGSYSAFVLHRYYRHGNRHGLCDR